MFLAVHTGMRLGEVLALKWSAIDFDRATVHVALALTYVGREPTFVPPKTQRSRRTTSLPLEAVTWLKGHRRKQAARKLCAGAAWVKPDLGLVFDRGDGKPMRNDTTSNTFREIVRAIGCPGVRFHDTRHSFATRLLEAGVNAKVVSEMLGHASVAFTLDVYAHVMPGQTALGAAALQKALWGVEESGELS